MRKEHILEEIRRCADSNEGVPLGRERFERATGIKESDWAGKYWVRWNDALAEAGYGPNKLTTPHTDEHLLHHYALLVRELGRLPVQAELVLKRRSDPGFPSEKTFRRFGGKAEMAAAVAAYCQHIPELADIPSMCGHHGQNFRDEELVESDAEEDFGYVYLIKSGRFYKIGRSNSLGRREYEIALQLPERTSTIHVIKTDDPAGIETYWHRRFAEFRKNGEWFELSALHIKSFKRRRFM